MFVLLTENGAAGHQHSSSAFWEHGVRRGGAGLRSRSESRPENHRGEPVLPGDTGGPAAGALYYQYIIISSEVTKS